MKLEVKIEGNKIFAPLKGKMLIKTPEEVVRQEYLCRLANHYGYPGNFILLKFAGAYHALPAEQIE
jgi:type I restriction enzyme M protein